MLGDFKQSHAQGPDVGSYGVGLTSNTLWCHVIRGADERIGITLGAELAADTEVAELDLAIAAEQDV